LTKLKYIIISHSVACCGFDINIPGFILGANTSKAWHSKKIKNEIQFLDWDFSAAKKDFKKTLWHHMELAERGDYEIIMMPDIMHNYSETNIKNILSSIPFFEKHSKRVILPVHLITEEIIKSRCELAYPNSKVFSPINNFTIFNHQKQFTHILGGTPTKQINMFGYFPNLQSIDGNSIFRGAISYGKYWESPNKWIQMKDSDLYTIFRKSATNLISYLTEQNYFYDYRYQHLCEDPKPPDPILPPSNHTRPMDFCQQNESMEVVFDNY
jgi:hypothetical protein